MARSSHPTDFSNSSDSSDESSVDYSLISKSELTDRSLLPTRSDPKDKRFDSQVIFQENSQKNSSLEYGDTSDSEISKIDSSSKAVKRKSVDHCNMKPSFEKETPIPVFYESSTDDSENELLPRSIQTNRRSSTRIRNSADPGSMPNKKIDSEKSKEDEKVVDNGPMKDYKFYFNHYPSSCVKEDILDSFARNSNRQRMTLQPFKRVKTSNKPEPGRKSNWGMPGVTKYRTTSKMVPMKFAPQMMEIDWNHVNLGSADYLFTTEKEKELERSAEAAQWYSDFESEDEKDIPEGLNDEITKKEEPLFTELLSAINIKAIDKAIVKGKRFPTMDETALYATGYLYREYLRHLKKSTEEKRHTLEKKPKRERVILDEFEEHEMSPMHLRKYYDLCTSSDKRKKYPHLE